MTNCWPGLICHRHLGPCFRHLANRHGHPVRRHDRLAHRHGRLEHHHEHPARHREHLVPAPPHPSLYRRHPSPSHQHCASSSTVLPLPSVPLVLSICPTCPGFPRCLCFPSTSSKTFLNSCQEGRGNIQDINSLNRPRVVSFVAAARIVSTSTIMSMIMFVIVVVGVILV